MMEKDNIRIFENPQATAKAFGEYLVSQVSGETEYHVALSGGSTPKLLFEYLGEEYPRSDAWTKVHFYWGDERCVPPEDDESNYKMAKELLLNQMKVPEANIHRIKGEEDPQEEANRYSQELLDHLPDRNGFPVFDMIILGLGEDGHTASIFPHQMELLESGNICDVATHPDSGQKRVTLSGEVINSGKQVAFLVTGAKKAEKVGTIVNKQEGCLQYPAAHVAPHHGNVLWFLDEPAAAQVK